MAQIRVPDVHELRRTVARMTPLQFRFFRKEHEIASPDLGRRRTLTGLAAGAAAVPLMRANTGLGKSRHERLLRPPGSVDESDFLSRCIRCGECMKVCPNNSLHPTLTEAGLEGLWTPTLVPRIGYCEPSCVLCSEVCPTGAIWQITPKEKGWVVGVRRPPTNQPVRLGTAFYDRGRCLPWALATDCIVCEEWCPVSPKAIYVEEAHVIDSAGNIKTTETAARRSQPLCRLRRMRVCLPAAGEAGRLRHQHRREPLAQQPDSAEQKLERHVSESECASNHRGYFETCGCIVVASQSLALSGCKKKNANPFPASGAVAGWEKSSETRTFAAEGSLAVHRRRFRAVHSGRRGLDLNLRLQVSGTTRSRRRRVHHGRSRWRANHP